MKPVHPLLAPHPEQARTFAQLAALRLVKTQAASDTYVAGQSEVRSKGQQGPAGRRSGARTRAGWRLPSLKVGQVRASPARRPKRLIESRRFAPTNPRRRDEGRPKTLDFLGLVTAADGEHPGRGSTRYGRCAMYCADRDAVRQPLGHPQASLGRQPRKSLIVHKTG
jgi:hypothetical protein